MSNPIPRTREARGYTPWLAAALSAILAVPPALCAQVAAPDAVPTTQTLKIVPLAGDGAFNDLEHKMMSPLVVQVLDQNDLPVEGATVVFRFPLNGASATFSNDQTSQTVRTNANGQARATGWNANSIVGTFKVQVTAMRGMEQGTGTVSMTNVTRITEKERKTGGHWWSSKWAKIGYIAAAAGIVTGIILATRDSTTTIQGTAGTPTIGGPQ